jgi:hypothetical protein
VCSGSVSGMGPTRGRLVPEAPFPVAAADDGHAERARFAGDRCPARSLVAAIAAISLVGYTSLFFGFQRGLLVQAGLIVTILAAIGLAAETSLSMAVAAMPRALRSGLGLYAGAALWGAAVGVLAGNPLRYVTSQLLAMLLLPAGAIVHFAHRRFRFEVLAAALAAACVLALAIHVLVPLVAPGLRSPLDPPGVLRLRFGVGFTAVAVLALVYCLAWTLARASWLAASGVVAAAVLIVGGMGRGAWVASLCGLLVLLALVPEHRRRAVWLAALAGVLALASGAALVIASSAGRELAHLEFGKDGAAIGAPRESIPASRTAGHAWLLDATGGGKGRELATGPIEDAVVLDVSGWLQGPEGSRATVWAEARDASGARIGRAQGSVPGGRVWRQAAVSMPVPGSATRYAAGVWVDSGRWLVGDMRVIAVGNRFVGVLRHLAARVATLSNVVTDPASDGTVGYRLRELHGVLSRWSQAGALRLAIGQGLGAQFPFVNTVWADDGQPASAPVASYIHNVYVFFAFKLGVAGLAALGALLIVAGSALREALGDAGHGVERWPLAAAVAIWAAYLMWGITSPEIIDFRVAPLLGAVAAATGAAQTAGRPGQAPDGRPSRPSTTTSR